MKRVMKFTDLSHFPVDEFFSQTIKLVSKFKLNKYSRKKILLLGSKQRFKLGI